MRDLKRTRVAKDDVVYSLVYPDRKCRVVDLEPEVRLFPINWTPDVDPDLLISIPHRVWDSCAVWCVKEGT